MLLGVPLTRVLRRIRETRERRYLLFRGFFRGVTDESEDREEALQPRLHSVMLTPGSGAIGKSLAMLDLAASGVEVTSVRRRNVRTAMPAPTSTLEEGDVLVLMGTEEALAAAEMKLMQG
jgi:CPA2 family monovalent cation:H+ antiporter-2